MKVTKVLVCIFLTTFLIGCLMYLIFRIDSAPKNTEVKITPIKNSNTAYIPNQSQNVKSEPEFEPEIFNIPDYSENEEEPDYKIKLLDILETGNNFDKEEIEEVKSGETWLGLFRGKNGFYLRDAKIKIRPEQRKNYGRDNSLTIKLNRKSESVFMLKNAGKLKKGKVETLYRRASLEESEPMKIGFSRTFKFGNRTYTFEVRAGLTDTNEKRSVLLLKSGNKSHIIYYNLFFEAGDNIGEMLWVGDLDRDGKLDFYLDFYTFEKGGYDSGLFLSSEAEKGDLVKQVAAFGTNSGC